MGKFRRRPVIVEAMQFWSAGGVDGGWPLGVYQDNDSPTRYAVETIHGSPAWVGEGDWIIPEPDGVHYYPCKPDIFAATYEPVEDSVTS